MKNTINNLLETENQEVQEVNCGFSAHADKLAELLGANDLSAMEELLHQSLFESLVSNLAEAERRLKNSSDKDYKKNFTVYESLVHQCSRFILRDIDSKRDRDDLIKKMGRQICDEMKGLFGIIIDLIEAFQAEVKNSKQVNFTTVCVRLDKVIVEMNDPVKKTFDEIINILKMNLNRYFMSKNLLDNNKQSVIRR